MSTAISYGAQLVGLHAEMVTVEVDISNGLHHFSVIGLGDRSIEESKDRVSAAIKNSGYISPKQKNQKVVVSLAPADIRKEGPAFDLAIAVAYLAASADIEYDPRGKIFLGELSLDGQVRKVSGVLPILCQAVKEGFTDAIIPAENAAEASLALGIRTYAVSTLNEALEHISGTKILPAIEPAKDTDLNHLDDSLNQLDIGLIRGNETAKRALTIAAAGAHNIIMYGPPGTGKTMLAQSFASILPPLSFEHALEVTSIYSAANLLNRSLITRPPFRAPHHTASNISIIGGGTFPRPGEITLAHRGVLFMDEFPEFDRQVMESLRQPLEDKSVTITRVHSSLTFPAQTILLASMNPCPCGKGKSKYCICSARQISNYWKRVSGPIMDRLDLWVHVDKVEYDKLASPTKTTNQSVEIAKLVERARTIQKERFVRAGRKISFNSEMNAHDIENLVQMTSEARRTLLACAQRYELSGRGFHRLIKVAQTIADLECANSVATKDTQITREHILEALQYRRKNF